MLIPDEGSPPGRLPPLHSRPMPHSRSRSHPADGGAREGGKSGSRGWTGWAVGSGSTPASASQLPTRGRGLASTAAAAPRLPRPQPPPWPPPPPLLRTLSQTLASLRSRSQQRSRDSNCSRLLRRARGTLPAPDPPLGSQRLPVPAFPAESVVLVPAPTGQPPPPPPSGQ